MITGLWTTPVSARGTGQAAARARAPDRPARTAGRLFRGSEAVARGLVTPAQLRSTAWHRIRHDVYLDATVPVTHRIRVAAVALVMPPSAAFADLTAAALWGVPGLVEADDPVHVVVPPGERWTPSADVRARAAGLDGDVVTLGGVRVTDRRRTAVDLPADPVISPTGSCCWTGWWGRG